MNFDNKFPARLLSMRSEQGLTQSELAERVGVAQRTIASYEIGESTPRLKVLLRLASVLGTSPDWLTDGLKVEERYEKEERKNSTTSKVPVLTESQIVSRFELSGTISSYDGFIHTDIPVGSNAFAYALNDDSMLATDGGEYSFPMGSMVVFDPDLDIKSGDFVLVILFGEAPQVFFRRFTGGMAVAHFHPLNANYPKDEVSLVDLREKSLRIVTAVSVVQNLPASSRVNISSLAMQVIQKAEYESPAAIAEKAKKQK
ncbi:XRE family transcriptional regulator [Leclercia adecarboxylata ATCC 23216 = NBRC 102595]|nr:XRE family transcriptional regulator [Leclercia adecarboxylata ATCC 23216 = NBRC 102595]